MASMLEVHARKVNASLAMKHPCPTTTDALGSSAIEMPRHFTARTLMKVHTLAAGLPVQRSEVHEQ